MINDIKKYLGWALLQQFFVTLIYQYFFTISSKIEALIITIFFFTMLHFPNKFLMVLVIIFETIILYFYVNQLSLFWIVPIHATIAVFCKRYLPESLTQGMRVLGNFD